MKKDNARSKKEDVYREPGRKEPIKQYLFKIKDIAFQGKSSFFNLLPN